ncbi:MAG: sensor domain-containing diguanylate cyclase [Pseudomonadota bacterium]
MGNIVAEQSRQQQQAVSPVYKLVRDELLRPLYIAETFASSIHFTTTMDSTALDEDALIDRLKKMEEDLDLIFFVASEQTRRQYFSNGRKLELVEGEVAWYFEAIERDRDFMADLGQVGDVHLFFDVKIYGPEREFLGYVGVGKRIQQFLDTFDRFKSLYGYDFLFVDNENKIILSSLPDLVVTGAYIPTLDSLEGFQANTSPDQSYDSELIKVQDDDFLISEFRIEELGWRLLLLSPLEARQASTTRAFVTSVLAAIVMVAVLTGVFLVLLLLYRRGLERKAEVDILTGLPNRNYVQRRIEQWQRSDERLSVVIIDLDHFKTVNDTYGHEAGDRVLKAAADTFKRCLSERDVIGRWGGEEFVMLIPSTSIAVGSDIAERARQELEQLMVATQDSTVSITASFGVAFGSARESSLRDLLSNADEALYIAKQNGRNQVRLHNAEPA